jgi:hypothetical protein
MAIQRGKKKAKGRMLKPSQEKRMEFVNHKRTRNEPEMNQSAQNSKRKEANEVVDKK